MDLLATATVGATAPARPVPSRAGAEAWHHRLYVACEEFSDIAGIINAGYGRLVDLAVTCLAEGHDVGPGLHTPGQFIAWQTGVAKATANKIVRIAQRVDDLPYLTASLRAGEISLDQADVVAQLCPARYDHAATELAKVAGVQQLRTTLAAYRDPDDERSKGPKRPRGISITRDDDGATIHARVSGATADVFEQTLNAMAEDCYRQRQADGDGTEAIEPVTREEAFEAMCEAAARHGEAAVPGAERYLVNYHLHTDAEGRLCLTDDRGVVVNDADRRQILCDHHAEGVFHDGAGIPISVGRKTRSIGPKLRRAILFRHRHRCAVPGCDTSRGLEIHHIVHWEDGGDTATRNLIALCHRHHTTHHQGLLLIDGDADLPTGFPGAVRFRTPDRRTLPDTIPPRPVLGPTATSIIDRLRGELDRRTLHHHHRTPGPVASTPTGERIDRRTFHLQPGPPAPPSPAPVVPLRT